MTNYEELLEKDLKYIWHPFTQMKDYETDKPIILEKGKGIYVWDKKGNKYIDAVASWWVNTLGHSNDRLNKALKEQVEKVEHVMLAGFTHEPAIKLAEKLVEITHPELTRVFYSDNGSTAVEVSLKMAYQYWYQKGKPDKSKFIALKNSYHGDTLGTVSVGGVDLFHKIYKPLLFDIFQGESPYCYRCPQGKEKETCLCECLNSIENMMKENSEIIAGIIIEPLCQGAGGMRMYPSKYLIKLRALCDKYNVLLIDDEVAMGFGRTGKLFAYEHANICPDIICLAKGLSAGYMPLAVTMMKEKIYQAFYDDYEKFKTFYHGHSFTGNPLACAIAVENIRILQEEDIIEKNKPKIKKLTECLKKLKNHKNVGDIRQTGMVAAVEIVKDKDTKEIFDPLKRIEMQIYKEGLKLGAILRPIGNTFYMMPPYVITENEIEILTDILHKAITKVLD